jgi:DNA-binding SARP family transcriptional activator
VRDGETHIRLCGRFGATIGGAAVEPPGRQGRVLFAYLTLNRARSVGRDELLGVLWPEHAPADPSEALSALLSRLRRAVGADAIQGRRELRLLLSDDAYVDVEVASAAVERAEAALDRGEPAEAVESARAAGAALNGGFMPGDELPWVEERRRDVEELRLRALEAEASGGIACGIARLPAAERAARALVAEAPFRESGHRLLMEALASRGDAAEALRVYDDVRVLLRDELGTAPGPALQTLHARLLAGELAPAEPRKPEPPEPPPPAEERKLVTVLCAEPAPPGDPADPEELRAALSEVEERLRAVVERFGGSLQEREPLQALFGATESHEDDAERAIRAALRACERGDVRRAAVASGEAIVAGAERSATGQVVARARALLASAPAGRVAVDADTARAARTAAEFLTSEGATIVAGLHDWTQPIAAAPLIGRRRELAALEQLYGTVVDRGSALLVTLAGQAGIGKSRLAEELAARVERRGAAVYHGRCLPYGERIAFWPLREVLCEAAGIALDDPARTARRKLRRLADPLGLDEPTTAALAASSGISLEDAGRDWASPEEVEAEIALAWPGFLSSLAQRGPVVVVIEDLHWAAPELLVTLERIVARSEGPLMLLTTARPEFAEANPGWSHAAGMSRIALDALSRADSVELTGRLLPEAPVELRERVAELAEGNPFFAEEIARHIGAGGDPAESLPHGLRALLAARIDALPPAEKSALQHAAVVGRRFWLSALEPNRTGEALGPLFEALEERGLVAARPMSELPGEREYWFAHGLTREVAYRSIPRAQRCRTHAAVGEWIARLAGDRRREFIYLLAYHYEAAAASPYAEQAWPDCPEECERVRANAVQALLEAGSAARQGLLSGDPVSLADRALALARDDRERLAALQLRARAFHAAVRGDEALAGYLEALALAGALGDRAVVANIRAHAALLCTRYMGAFSDTSWVPAARAIVEEGLAESGESTESFEVGALLVGRSWGRARWNDVTERDVAGARRDIERAVEIAERLGSNFLLTHALEGLTWLALEEGYCAAESMAERLLSAGNSLGNRVEAHESIGVAAICFARAGRFEEARAAAAETTRQAAALSRHRALHAGAFEAIALVPGGHFGQLLEVTARVPQLAEEEGTRVCATGMVALAGRALALFEAGEEHEAERVVELLRRLAPSARWVRTYGHPTAEMLRPILGPEATRRWIDESERRGDVGTETNRMRALLPVLVQRGDDTELRAAVAEARELAGRACAPALGWLADLAEAALWTREGRCEDAVAHADAAASALDRHGEHYTAARALAELLPQLDCDAAADLARRTTARLTDMGAMASARLLLASRAPWQTNATR